MRAPPLQAAGRAALGRMLLTQYLHLPMCVLVWQWAGCDGKGAAFSGSADMERASELLRGGAW